MRTRTSGARRGLVIGGAAVAAVAVAGIALLARGDTEPAEAALSFDFEADDVGALGSDGLDVAAVTRDGGILTLESGPDGRALRFPTYEGTDARRAVLTVRADDEEQLEPGTADFTFGADLWLDAVSEGTEFDNGNNVLQRGLFSDGAQFKLQVDRGTASCRVAGEAGEVVVTASEPLRLEQWYRVECSRTGEQVRLLLTALEGDENAVETVVEGPTGAVLFDAATPLTLGAKTDAAGVVPASSDQFNGAMDNVEIVIGG